MFLADSTSAGCCKLLRECEAPGNVDCEMLLGTAVQFATGAGSDVADVAGEYQPVAVPGRWPRSFYRRSDDHIDDEGCSPAYDSNQ